MKEIRTAIIGVGNCASSLVQGRYYYDDPDDEIPGLITRNFSGYRARDIRFAAAFDVDERKVGLDLARAIFAPPNCTTAFFPEVPKTGISVEMGYAIDSLAGLNGEFPEAARCKPRSNIYADAVEAKAAIARQLRDAAVEVVVNYLPVGSEKNTLFYADCALEAGCAFVNAVPVFVSRIYGHRFREAGLPLLGDDVKSQVGATIIHRALAKLFEDRGQPVKRTYQFNMGGNTDFMSMLDRTRLESKRISKTESVISQMGPRGIEPENIHIGPSDYVPWLRDNKLCFLRIEAEQFGGVPMHLEARLSVEDSPNSAGVIVDAIRAAKVALDRKLAGPIPEASAYLFKSPPEQIEDSRAREMLREFAKPTPAEETASSGAKRSAAEA